MNDLTYLYVLAEAAEQQEENSRAGHESLHIESRLPREEADQLQSAHSLQVDCQPVLCDDRDDYAYPTFYL